MPSLTAKKIESLELSMPEIDEQEVICNVLSDMDGEINRLEEKLDKYRLVKQGMMQKLLTGEIRLM